MSLEIKCWFCRTKKCRSLLLSCIKKKFKKNILHYLLGEFLNILQINGSGELTQMTNHREKAARINPHKPLCKSCCKGTQTKGGNSSNSAMHLWDRHHWHNSTFRFIFQNTLEHLHVSPPAWRRMRYRVRNNTKPVTRVFRFLPLHACHACHGVNYCSYWR